MKYTLYKIYASENNCYFCQLLPGEALWWIIMIDWLGYKYRKKWNTFMC